MPPNVAAIAAGVLSRLYRGSMLFFRSHAPKIVSRATRLLDKDLVEVLRGASLAFTIRVVGAGIGFLFNLVLARRLGPAGTGIFYLGTMVLTTSSIFGRVGLEKTVLRWTATHSAAGKWSLVRAVYTRSMLLATAASAVTAAAMFSGATWLASHVFSEPALAPVLRWFALAVVPVSLLTLQTDALKGIKQIGWASAMQYQGGIVVPLLAVTALFFFGAQLTVSSAAIIYSLALAVALLFTCIVWSKSTPRQTTEGVIFSSFALLSTSMPMLGIAVANLVTGMLPMVLLGIWSTASDVGIFGIAVRVAALTSFVLVAVNSIAAPKFAALHASGSKEELRRTVRNCTNLTLAVATPVLGALLLWPEVVLSLFGHEFSSGGALALQILAVGQFVNVGAGSVGNLLMMAGCERPMQKTVLVAALASLLLCLVLIPAYGLTGAAAASSLTLAGTNIALVYLAWRRLGISTVSNFWRSKR